MRRVPQPVPPTVAVTTTSSRNQPVAVVEQSVMAVNAIQAVVPSEATVIFFRKVLDENATRETIGEEDLSSLIHRVNLRGGSLGWIEGQQIPSFFVDILTGMEAGDVSEPFRTSSSFHIVKVNELRSAIQRSEINQTHARHILITPNEIIDDETAKQRLDDALAKIRSGEEDFAEQAKLLSDDPGSANLGGDLGWSGPGTFVPELEAVIDAAEIGEPSGAVTRSTSVAGARRRSSTSTRRRSRTGTTGSEGRLRANPGASARATTASRSMKKPSRALRRTAW